MSSRHRPSFLFISLALLGASPVLAAPPSVEAVIHFTGGQADSSGRPVGNGAFPPHYRSSTPSPMRILAEGADGHLYGSTPMGGGTTVSLDGGIGDVFYRWHADSGQQVLDRSSVSNVLRPSVMTRGSDGYLYAIEGGLRRYTPGNGWEVVAAPAAGTMRTAWVEGADGRMFSSKYDRNIWAVNKDGVGGIVSVFTAPTTVPAQLIPHLSHSNGRLYVTSRVTLGIFSLLPNGTDFQTVKTGLAAGSEIVNLIEGRDKRLYGATLVGGANNNGYLFRLNADGSDYRVLHEFSATVANVDGIRPNTLLLASDGHLYGSARNGGINDQGTIFRWNTTLEKLEPLYAFTRTTVGANTPPRTQNIGNNSDGVQPHGLMQMRDGHFYGVASLGGSEGWGTLFRFNVGTEVPTFLYQPRADLSVTASSGTNNSVSASGTRVQMGLGLEATFNWRSVLLADCVASSSEPGSTWAGTQAVNGPAKVKPARTGTWTYSLTCQSTSAGLPAPVTETVTLEVLPGDPELVQAGNGGGGFGIAQGLLLLAGITLLRRPRPARR